MNHKFPSLLKGIQTLIQIKLKKKIVDNLQEPIFSKNQIEKQSQKGSPKNSINPTQDQKKIVLEKEKTLKEESIELGEKLELQQQKNVQLPNRQQIKEQFLINRKYLSSLSKQQEKEKVMAKQNNNFYSPQYQYKNPFEQVQNQYYRIQTLNNSNMGIFFLTFFPIQKKIEIIN
eukprot:TRINITY_DN27774_c0_g1_i2.p3 TRINITY_DN27774_c0_g1~~TRINITY_DN27774_c0_g1_i2.p3  ORF type:complete len:174 (-),score=37.27 TRINITY_DN27774_c0_g1_i2:325-846(-)